MRQVAREPRPPHVLKAACARAGMPAPALATRRPTPTVTRHQHVHLCLWTWMTATPAIWCLALVAINVFSMEFRNCGWRIASKVWEIIKIVRMLFLRWFYGMLRVTTKDSLKVFYFIATSFITYMGARVICSDVVRGHKSW